MPSLKNHRKDRLTEIIDFIVRKLDPEKIILFGSQAKGTARLGSDFDLVVVGKASLDFRSERKLKEELDRIAGLYTVDLLFWNKISPEFRKIILKTGEIVYEKN
ncbi:nucleotidyltransferase family protein [Thermodesulfatator autotrophicus]|uniref:Polymerase beta nucleotidyltransferase domain-containing protein n=1 Tax=Thermodesulfatator autotrophicus TaxID=1795632 RepID=A0A177E667_9BACT|nr:nucleotidyltransferase domain-containing protein [Thermodesulfatator autotrophicus]OAG26930.1 hypothetical protein TH606_09700 [Thermodesulfatator autotrophicus]